MLALQLDLTPPGLIQHVRIGHALIEAGVTLCIDRLHRNPYEYLKKFFEIDYRPARPPIPFANVRSNHARPFVRVGDEERVLLFPHVIPRKMRVMWKQARSGTVFRGFVPDHRKGSLSQWHGRATITATNQGRSGLTRFWDEEYLQELASAEFALCPNGGYPWTYRFFEAVLCGATPIVERRLPCYEGFYYHLWNDKEFKRRDIEKNYSLAVQRLTMPHEVILKNVCR